MTSNYWILDSKEWYLAQHLPDVSGAGIWLELDDDRWVLTWSPHGRGWSFPSSYQKLGDYATQTEAQHALVRIAHDLARTSPVLGIELAGLR